MTEPDRKPTRAGASAAAVLEVTRQRVRAAAIEAVEREQALAERADVMEAAAFEALQRAEDAEAEVAGLREVVADLRERLARAEAPAEAAEGDVVTGPRESPVDSAP